MSGEIETESRVGLLLAGGRSRRMGGGDKFLREIDGVRLIDHVLARLAPQVGKLVISVNGNAQGLAGCGVPLVEDAAGQGPLAGILAGLRWSGRETGDGAVVVSVPADTPFLPRDLVARLADARRETGAEIAVATSLGRVHHAVAAWPVTLGDALEGWLSSGGSAAVRAFLASRRTVAVEFAAATDSFFNVNTPGDLALARRLAQDAGLP